jgi:acyl carrier protein
MGIIAQYKHDIYNVMAIEVSEVIAIINSIVHQKESNTEFLVEEDSPLVGSGSLVDSMGLVQMCLALEEKSEELGFSFDWTSEKAMSSLQSVFRTPRTVTEEFNRQMAEAKEEQ